MTTDTESAGADTSVATEQQAGSGSMLGQSAPSWRDSLSEEFRADPSLQSLKDVNDLAKSYVNAQKLIGREKVPVPKSEDDKESWDRLYKVLGRPDTPDDYDFQKPEGLPFELDEEKTKAWKSFMHESGLSDKQAKAIFQKYLEEAGTEMTTYQEAEARSREEGINKLREEWRDKFDGNVDIARSAIQKFGDDELRQWLTESGLGNEPRLIRLFEKIGRSMMDDRAEGSGDNSFVTSSAHALREIESLKMDKDFYQQLSAGNKAAKDRWSYLHRVAYGTA